MKRILAVVLIAAMTLGLSACAGTKSADKAASEKKNSISSSGEQKGKIESDNSTPKETGDNALVVYFSATGNTRAVAETLARLQSADLNEIVPEQPYTEEDLDYNNDTCRANQEQNDDSARPAITENIENINDYDVIYVGFPIWWGTLPKILYTFFDTYDLSGKTIAPFCTSGGSGISSAVEIITELEPDAVITEGLRTEPDNAEEDLTQWLQTIGVTE